MRRRKKPGWPSTRDRPAAKALAKPRAPGSSVKASPNHAKGPARQMPSQNSRSRATRFSGRLPAISATLIAPIEMPA